MPELFRRAWDLRIGPAGGETAIRVRGEGAGDGAEVSSLDVAFEVTKTSEREPNKATIRVYNLSPAHRRQLEGAQNLAVILAAGYRSSISTLFSGDVRRSANLPGATARRRRSRGGLTVSTDDLDVITQVEAEDGGRAWRDGSVQRSFGPGTRVRAVLDACVEALGVGQGNLDDLGPIAIGDLDTYPSGTVLSGRAHAELQRVARSCGLTWSVQNGELQFRRPGRPLSDTAIMLSPESGLLGSPAPNADGQIEARALLVPGLRVGRPIELRSRLVSGTFEVRSVRYTGDTASEEWTAELTLVPR